MIDYSEAYAAEMHKFLTLIDRLEVMGTRHADWTPTYDAAREAERRLIAACDFPARRLIERLVRKAGDVRYALRFSVWAPAAPARFRTPANVKARIWLFPRTGRQRINVADSAPSESRVTLCVPWRPDAAHARMLEALLGPGIDAARKLHITVGD